MPAPPATSIFPFDIPAMLDLDSLYRAESRSVLATLIRLLGDFDLAEEALVG